MRVVITGGAGYVGSAVTSHLLAAGFELCVFDKLVYGSESLLAFAHHPRCRLVIGDVRDTAALAGACAGADAIVHLAAVVGESACSVDEAAAWSINVDGVRSALEAYRRSLASQFLFVSTCSNYGIATESIATEDTGLRPLSLYARSKVRAEELVLGERRDVCALRFGTICGLSARMRFDLLVNDMARAAATRRQLRVYGPEAWRPMLDIADAARAIHACLTAPTERGRSRLFNVVGENVQKSALVDVVRRHFPDTPIDVAASEADPRDYRVSCQRIQAELGYVPGRRVEDSLLSVARAVATGVFRDPFWEGHSAIPADAERLAPHPGVAPAGAAAGCLGGGSFS